MRRAPLPAALPAALTAALLALTTLAAPPARAQGCSAGGSDNLGRLVGGNVARAFARIDGGSVSPGNAQRVTITVTPCFGTPGFFLHFATPLTVSNGARTVAVYPVVTAVNGTALPSPHSLVDRAHRLALSGTSATLEIVYAIAAADAAAIDAPGTWTGTGTVTFEDQ